MLVSQEGWKRRRIAKRLLTRTAMAMTGALRLWLDAVPPAEGSWTPTINISPARWGDQDSPTVAVDRQGAVGRFPV